MLNETIEVDETTTTETTNSKRSRMLILVPALAVVVLLIGAVVIMGVLISRQGHQLGDLRAETGRLEGALSDSQSALDDVQDKNALMAEELSRVDEREQIMDQQSMDLAEREEQVAAKEAEVLEREKAVGVAEEVAAKNSFGSGVHLVNVDIAPGTYRNEGTKSCYWARLSGTSGEFGDLITNGLPSGPAVVTIAQSDVAFESSNCGTWTLVE